MGHGRDEELAGQPRTVTLFEDVARGERGARFRVLLVEYPSGVYLEVDGGTPARLCYSERFEIVAKIAKRLELGMIGAPADRERARSAPSEKSDAAEQKLFSALLVRDLGALEGVTMVVEAMPLVVQAPSKGAARLHVTEKYPGYRIVELRFATGEDVGLG